MSNDNGNWRVPNNGQYLIDVDVLARIHVRKDSAEIYKALVVMAQLGVLRTVRQTFDELRPFNPQYQLLKEEREAFQIPTAEQFDSRVAELIEELGNNAAYLWEQTGGKNPDPADPWLVAVAGAYGYTLVTNESPRSLKRIPAACRLPTINCRCIRGPHFLFEVGLVKDLKPEHIDLTYFFETGE
jgi:hypothetical protein